MSSATRTADGLGLSVSETHGVSGVGADREQVTVEAQDTGANFRPYG